MEGKILGINAADGSGAISGDDGQRHNFSMSDWRGDRPPAVGMKVDFESEGGIARDIYPLGVAAFAGPAKVFSGGSAAPAASDSASGSGSGSGGPVGGSIVDKLKSQLTTTLAFPLALIVVIAFFLPAISGMDESFNQFDLGKQAKAVGVQIADTDINARTAQMDQDLQNIDQDIARQRNAAANDIYGMPFASYDVSHLEERKTQIQQERAALAKSAGSIGMLKTTISAFMLRFGALAAALALLWMSWSSHRLTSKWSLVTGGLSLVTAALVFAFESGTKAAMRIDEVVTMLDDAQIDAAISVGIGTWLIIAAGVALIASGLGFIRNPLAGR